MAALSRSPYQVDLGDRIAIDSILSTMSGITHWGAAPLTIVLNSRSVWDRSLPRRAMRQCQIECQIRGSRGIGGD